MSGAGAEAGFAVDSADAPRHPKPRPVVRRALRLNPERNQLLDTFKEAGWVSEVFREPPGQVRKPMSAFAGRAAIGHVRDATAGAEDRSYAQPFERRHVEKHKWFSFPFNGQLANYQSSRRTAGQRQ